MSNPIHFALYPPRFIRNGIKRAPRRRQPTTPFEWPLRPLGDLEPRVLSVHGDERLGVDLGYVLAPRDTGERLVPVFATNDGEVSCAIESDTGCAISIDHSGTWSTHYTGLAKLSVIRGKPRLKRRELVRAGDIIGYATRPRIGFELWKWTDERGFVANDPRPFLAAWSLGDETEKEAA